MSGGGGSEPNLTPFIDLFSVMICFLLMTAAWIQLESMPSSIEKATTSDNPVPAEPKPPDKNEKKVSLAVTVMKEKIVLKENEKEIEVAHLANVFDKERLKIEFARWRATYVEKKDVVLNTVSEVSYGDMINMYDLLVASDWPDVGINPQ